MEFGNQLFSHCNILEFMFWLRECSNQSTRDLKTSIGCVDLAFFQFLYRRLSVLLGDQVVELLTNSVQIVEQIIEISIRTLDALIKGIYEKCNIFVQTYAVFEWKVWIRRQSNTSPQNILNCCTLAEQWINDRCSVRNQRRLAHVTQQR